MISMSTLGRNGRLGNQLFQIASVMGIAHHYDTDAVFPKWAYSQYFNGPFQEGKIGVSNWIREESFHHGIPQFDAIKLKDLDFDIKGYLQSEKYFIQIRERVREIFKFKKEFVIKSLEGFTHVYQKPTVAIHIRRGDYIGNKNYINLTPRYYLELLEKYFKPHKHEYNIVIFSDDIKWCKQYFFEPYLFFSEGKNDIEDLCRMKMCDHFIIANSSFSWWAAWLGEKPWSKIIRPDQHFAGPLKERADIKDYYPTRWITESTSAM